MESPVGQKQLMAILLTDVVNFSDQAAKNEEFTLRQLDQDLAMIRGHCGMHGGEVLKNTGDGLLACFRSSEKALEAAEEIQKGLLPRRESLAHRIGIHVGDVYRQETDILGDGVNLAARLTEVAESGGICVSESVHHSTRSRHGGFHIRPVRCRIRNAPREFRAYHLRPSSLLTFYRPTLGGIFRYGLILALAASFFVSPTVAGLEALSRGDFQPEPFFLAGLSLAQYPAGVFLGFAFWRLQGSRPGREILRRMALGFAVYAGVAGWLLSLLATSQVPPLVNDMWSWLFLLQATCSLLLRGFPGRRSLFRANCAVLLFFFAISPGMAQLEPSWNDFCKEWGAPIKRGRDPLGDWHDFKKSREWARVWTDRNRAVLQIQYRLPDYAACWTSDRLGQKADLVSTQETPQKVGLWERDHAPPMRSSTPRFSTEYWARRDPDQISFSAHAIVANELTSIWMLPPFVILFPLTTDLDRPITLTIRSQTALPLMTKPSGPSIAEARRNFRP